MGADTDLSADGHARSVRQRKRILCRLPDRAEPVEKKGDDDEGPDEGALPERVDAEQGQAVADHLEEHRADYRAERGAAAAGEIGAADDDGGNGVKLDARAHAGGDRAEPADL